MQMYVVDSSCSEQEMAESRDTLSVCLSSPSLSQLPLLLAFTKNDIPTSRPITEVAIYTHELKAPLFLKMACLLSLSLFLSPYLSPSLPPSLNVQMKEIMKVRDIERGRSVEVVSCSREQALATRDGITQAITKLLNMQQNT